MRKQGWLICFGYAWSEKRVYGSGNITLQFYNNGKKILWINPIPNRGLKINGFSKDKKTFFKRIWEKLIQQFFLFKIRSKNFYIVSPIYIPLVENKLVYEINKLLVYIQVRMIGFFLKIQEPLVCTMGTNDNLYLIKKIGYTCWFHIAGDLYHDLRGAPPKIKQFLYVLESKIFNNCDVVFLASKLMVEKAKKMVVNQEKVKYLPHGSDIFHFSKESVVNSQIAKIQKPIVGYYGSLTDANDQEILLAIAEHGFNLVLIGDVFGDYSACKKYPNIHFINAVPYNTLPEYARHFDVGIMAWKPAQWIANCNPKKTYEYLALGLPIVSVPIPQLEYELGDFISFASTPSEFVEKIIEVLAKDTPALKKARVNRAEKESWENRFEFLQQTILPYVRSSKI